MMDQIRFGSAQISKIVVFGLLVLIALGLSIAPLRAWMSARRPKKCQAILLVLMTYMLVSALMKLTVGQDRFNSGVIIHDVDSLAIDFVCDSQLPDAVSYLLACVFNGC